MNLEHSLKVVEAAVAEFNERDWERFGEVHAEEVILTAPSLAEPAKGRRAVEDWARGLATAFPDLIWEPIHSFGQDDQVGAEIIARGTHTGPLNTADGKTIPATNKPVQMSIGGFFKVEGDTVSEVHLYNDLLSLLKQLEVV